MNEFLLWNMRESKLPEKPAHVGPVTLCGGLDRNLLQAPNEAERHADEKADEIKSLQNQLVFVEEIDSLLERCS